MEVEIGGSVETQIGASRMSFINSPKIVSRAISGRTPRNRPNFRHGDIKIQ